MLTVDGQACAFPHNPSAADGAATTIDLKVRATHTARLSGVATLAGPPTTLADSMAIKFVVMRSLNRDPLVAFLTSAQGASQAVPFDDVLVLSSNTVPYSLVQVSGTGALEYLIAGA